MIMKRCNNGHYYDGEKYKECPSCKGMGQNAQTWMPDMSFGDYADEEDTVTVALPRSQGQRRQPEAYAPQGQGRQSQAYAPQGRQSGVFMPQGQSGQRDAYASDDDESVTVALPRQSAGGAARKPSFKPVVGWLVGVRGSDFGSSFTIRLGKNYIGRSADMDIILHGDDSIAMKNHAAIYYVPKQRRYAVEPGTSGKRFYLNRDAVVRPVWVKQHDILIIGNASLMFFPCCGEHFSWEELIRRQREKNQNR